MLERLEVEKCCKVFDLRYGVIGAMIWYIFCGVAAFAVYITQPLVLVGCVLVALCACIALYGIFKDRADFLWPMIFMQIMAFIGTFVVIFQFESALKVISVIPNLVICPYLAICMYSLIKIMKGTSSSGATGNGIV